MLADLHVQNAVFVHFLHACRITDRETAVNPYYKRGELMLNKEFNVSEEVTHKLLLSTKDLRLMDILGQGDKYHAMTLKHYSTCR